MLLAQKRPTIGEKEPRHWQKSDLLLVQKRPIGAKELFSSYDATALQSLFDCHVV
jgi:hypothetical protein